MIPDFGELMKENKLVTYLESVGPITPVERATSRMERWTQYWPLTISSTVVFNMGVHMGALTKLIVNDELTDDQVLDCKKDNNLWHSFHFTVAPRPQNRNAEPALQPAFQRRRRAAIVDRQSFCRSQSIAAGPSLPE